MVFKEKQLMTSFMLANISDSTITAIALNSHKGFHEAGIMGSNFEHNLTTAIIIKTGITAMLIGAYALAKAHQVPRYEYVYEKTLQASHLFIWGIVLFNMGQYLIS